MQVQPLGWEDPLEEGMATHSSILAWGLLWTEEPGGLQSTGLQRVGHDLASKQRHKQGTMTNCLLGTSPSFLNSFPTRLMAFTSPAPTVSLKDSHPHINDFSTVLVSKLHFHNKDPFSSNVSNISPVPTLDSVTEKCCSFSGSLVFLPQSPHPPPCQLLLLLLSRFSCVRLCATP